MRRTSLRCPASTHLGFEALLLGGGDGHAVQGRLVAQVVQVQSGAQGRCSRAERTSSDSGRARRRSSAEGPAQNSPSHPQHAQITQWVWVCNAHDGIVCKLCSSCAAGARVSLPAATAATQLPRAGRELPLSSQSHPLSPSRKRIVCVLPASELTSPTQLIQPSPTCAAAVATSALAT